MAQKLADFQKHASTICRSISKYRFKLSSDIAPGIRPFCIRVLDYTREIVESHQQGIETSVTEVLASFEQILKNLESPAVRALPNA